ncbi:MAG: hypothetical protein WAK83_25420, partial [Trebonia sp.]|uniref:hypothetical protein n=1 Tax=Trebonia sp. TaxID=2767075 RepID=UPI003BB16BDD
MTSGATGLSPYCPRTRFSRSQEASRDGIEANQACKNCRTGQHGAGRHQLDGNVRLQLRAGVDCADGVVVDGSDAWRALGAAVTNVVADTHLHLLGVADCHADHGDAAADHACADADADAVRASTSGGDRLSARDGLMPLADDGRGTRRGLGRVRRIRPKAAAGAIPAAAAAALVAVSLSGC